MTHYIALRLKPVITAGFKTEKTEGLHSISEYISSGNAELMRFKTIEEAEAYIKNYGVHDYEPVYVSSEPVKIAPRAPVRIRDLGESDQHDE